MASRQTALTADPFFNGVLYQLCMSPFAAGLEFSKPLDVVSIFDPQMRNFTDTLRSCKRVLEPRDGQKS